MVEYDNLPDGPVIRPAPRRRELEDGTTILTWHLTTAHPVQADQLMLVATEISNDTISLQVDQVENDSVVLSVKSNREVSHTAVWDFSMRCLLTIQQRLVELVTIEGAVWDDWRYSFVAAQATGAFDVDKTPLMQAAEIGDLGRLGAILATNAVNDIDQSTPFGLTALGYAALKGHVEAARLLINAGAQPLARGEITTLQGGLSGGVEIVRVLLAAGVDVNCRNRYGETALMTAAARGDLEIVNELLKCGADPNLEDKTSRTALDRARKYQLREVIAALEEAVKPSENLSSP